MGNAIKMLPAIVLAAAAVFVTASLAQAQANYPERPVKIIVPFPAGGPSDVQARIVAHKLQERLGQPFLIENRGGAGGNIGTQAAARAEPDGYTILFMTPAQVINMTLYAKPGYNLKTEFVPIGLVSTAPAILLAHPSLGASNLKELFAAVRAKPGVAFGSAGPGLSTHLMMEQIKTLAKLDMMHVPYRGSAPALNGLLAGDVFMLVDSVVSSLPHVRSGALRGIAVSTAKRTPVAPDIPTLAESGLPNFDAFTWYGMMAPAKTPEHIIRKIVAETNEVLKLPDVRERFLAMGSEPTVLDPAGFSKFIAEEAVRWDAVAKASGAKIE